MRHTSPVMLMVLLTSVLLTAAGCAPATSANDESLAVVADAPPAGVPSADRQTPPPEANALAGPLRTGMEAPDFALVDLDGHSVSLASLRGRPVMINFWASWCGPCRYEAPNLVRVYDDVRDSGFEILAVNIGEPRDVAQAFAQEFGFTFPVLLDAESSVAEQYWIVAIPTSYLVDAEGIIRYVHKGALSEEQLRQYVAGLSE